MKSLLSIFLPLAPRIAEVNSADRMSDVNASLDHPISDDEWFMVSPFGDHRSSHKNVLQKFDKPSADRMVDHFNSFRGRMANAFRGLPIYAGHPDQDRKTYPDDRRRGKIVEMEVREDGLWARPEWNSLGEENIKEGYWQYPSPYWDGPIVSGGFAPDRLMSVGLTNTPRIPGTMPMANDEFAEEPAEEDPTKNQQQNETMLIDQLRKLYKLPADSTEEKVLAAAAQSKEAADAAETEKAKNVPPVVVPPVEDPAKKEEANSKITLLQTQVKAGRKRHANSLLDSATKRGFITDADRPAWVGRFDEANSDDVFDQVAGELEQKSSGMNTNPLNLTMSRQAVNDEQGRRVAVANAIAAVQDKNPSLSYLEAHSQVKADPAMKPIFEAMKTPGSGE